MSRKDRKYYWRRLCCQGCERQCAYAKFKVFGRNGYREVYDMLRDEQKDPRNWRYKRRGTILGIMHEMKLERWERETAACAESQELRSAVGS